MAGPQRQAQRLFFGRQFVPDLGGVKIDGLRIDYASSTKFTLLGFGGLYPMRGSRSITTDYQRAQGPTTARARPGKFIGAGGFGAAYRTLNAYGSFGGVVLVPLVGGAAARLRARRAATGATAPSSTSITSRSLDLVGSAAAPTLTNLSAGVNYKPNQRLRLTASFNRVDTETLERPGAGVPRTRATQTGGGLTVVRTRPSSSGSRPTQARGGVSAGLGQLQRFEVSTALTYR